MSRLMSVVFMLLIFFSNLTNWSIFGLVSGFDIFMGLFIFFIALSLFDIKGNYGLRLNQHILLPVLVFFIWWLVRSSLSNSYMLIHYDELWQWVLLFVLFTNYISKDPFLGYRALSAYLGSSVAIMLIYYFGSNVLYESGRLIMFPDTNPNTIGSIISISLIIIFFFILSDVMKMGRLRFLLLLLIPFLFKLLIETGSRGALVYFGFGLLLLIVINRSHVIWMFFMIIALGLIVALIIPYVLESDIFRSRWLDSDLMDFGRRRDLWIESYRLFLERPVIGYGDGGYWIITNKDPHNLYIALLVTSGVIGFVLFMFFLYRVFRVAIYNIKLQKSIICFVLFAITALAFLKEGGALNSLSTWIRLSIIAGLGTAINTAYYVDMEEYSEI